MVSRSHHQPLVVIGYLQWLILKPLDGIEIPSPATSSDWMFPMANPDAIGWHQCGQIGKNSNSCRRKIINSALTMSSKAIPVGRRMDRWPWKRSQSCTNNRKPCKNKNTSWQQGASGYVLKYPIPTKHSLIVTCFNHQYGCMPPWNEIKGWMLQTKCP